MTGPAFLRTILASPDDDAPRLVYADWLDEHGQAGLAAFVRRGIKEGGLWEQTSHPLPPTAHAEAISTNIVFNKGEPDEFFVNVPSYFEAITFQRGFISGIRLPAASWLAHGDQILAAQPVTEVRLTTRPDREWLQIHVRMADVIDEVPGDEMFRNALGHRWPAVKTWHLPPEPQAATIDEVRRWTIEEHERAMRILAGDPDAPLPLGVMDVEERRASSAAPDARRRAGHSRMPAWLSEQRGQRPPRR